MNKEFIIEVEFDVLYRKLIYDKISLCVDYLDLDQ